MSILKQKLEFFNTTLQHLPKQLIILYHFGFWALTKQRITSIRGNARQVVTNPHTAKTKAWRLLKNHRWKTVMPALLKHCGSGDTWKPFKEAPYGRFVFGRWNTHHRRGQIQYAEKFFLYCTFI